MLRANLFWKFFAAFVALIGLTALLAGWIASSRVREDVERQADATLETQLDLLCELFGDDLPEGASAALQERVRATGDRIGTRITLIAADGTVIADSSQTPVSADNHAQRPEIMASRARGVGRAQRSSSTLGVPMVYMARALGEGDALRGYVRGAVPLVDLRSRLAKLRNGILGAAGLAILIGLLGAFLAARRLTRPLRSMRDAVTAIAAGDYGRRVRSETADEIGDLGAAFNEMAVNLEREVSQIRRDQREVTAILSGMTEGVLAVDEGGCVVRVNDAACRILDMTAEDARGALVWDALRPYEAPAALRRAVQRGEVRSEVVLLPGDGQVRTVLLHVSPLEAVGGLESGAIIVLNDITGQKRLEEIRRTFITNASHELKTPVASLRSMAETVLEDPEMEPDVRHTFLDRMLRQSDRLSQLVDEMLLLSRLEAKDGRLTGRHQLDVRVPVGEAVEDCQAVAQERNIGIKYDVADDALTVSGQDEAIRRIADNLLTNAIKYTPRGGWVRAKLKRAEESVVLEVADSGRGIPADQHDRIFERFYRVDEGRSRDVGGTGLGLAIVRHFVQALDGRIELESVPGQGSTFRVVLPAK